MLFLTIYYYVFLNFRCDSVDKLRNKLSSVEHEIQDANKFKEFYQFTFNYGKANTPGQKGKKLLKKKMIYLHLLKLFFFINRSGHRYCIGILEYHTPRQISTPWDMDDICQGNFKVQVFWEGHKWFLLEHILAVI